MHFVKRLTALTTGVSALALLATSVPVGAAPTSTKKPESSSKNQSVIMLGQKTSDAVNVDTELNCTEHYLTAKVTNNLAAKITPTVTFNGQPPMFSSDTPIPPGETFSYTYNFSGNDLFTEVKVAVDGYPDTMLSPTIHCDEPVTFTADKSGESAVTGYLRNNSTLIPQSVHMSVNGGPEQIIHLRENDFSHFVALPFKAYEGAKTAQVTVATESGIESHYTVNLNSLGMPIPLPTPEVK